MRGEGEKIKVVVADSQFLISESLKLVLKTEGFFVEAIVASKTELMNIFKVNQPELLITDVTLSDEYGIQDIIRLMHQYPDLYVLVLTNYLTKAELNELTGSRLKNIIYKTAGKKELLTAIDHTLKGKRYFCEEILDILTESLDVKPLSDRQGKITPSEIEIVKLIANGLTAKEIALKRNLSIHTVNTHRKNIFKKLEVSNASELIMVAIKAGWIDNIEYYI